MTLNIKQYEENICYCSRCGNCYGEAALEPSSTCFLRDYYGWESFGPRGRLNMCRHLMDGTLQYTNELVERIYSDLLCGACSSFCVLPIPHFDIFRAMRKDAVEAGLKLPKEIERIVASLDKAGNVFGAPKDNRAKWATELALPDKGDLVYFPGCYSSYTDQETAISTIKVLRAAGLDPAILGTEESCCGNPLLLSGHANKAEAFIKENARKLMATGAKTVVASCAECFRTLKVEYPKIVPDFKVNVLHTSQLMAQLVQENRLHYKWPTAEGRAAIVTYHDPCQLGRLEGLGVYDQPRKVIQSVPGTNFIEMPRNQKLARCCGAGGLVKNTNDGMATNIAVEVLHEANSTGAMTFITSCPRCKKNFKDGVKKDPMRLLHLKIVDLNEFIAMHLVDA